MMKDIGEARNINMEELKRDAMMKDIAEKNSKMSKGELKQLLKEYIAFFKLKTLIKNMCSIGTNDQKQNGVMVEGVVTNNSEGKTLSETEQNSELEAFLESEQKEAVAAKERESRLEAEKQALQEEYNRLI